MSNLQSSADKAQMIELLSSLKIPVVGNGGGSAFLGQYAWSPDYVTSAPVGWLICDGSTHLIADYPEYCALLASQHGAVNYYGGDGITTFATIDLRGEFIRGAGTNSHTNQGNGGAVGEHQDGTEIPTPFVNENNIFFFGKKDTVRVPINPDSIIGLTNNTGRSQYSKTATDTFTDIEPYGMTSGNTNITSRPTNTSGTFFVRATVVGDPNAHQYSTEEQVVGTWIDGNTLYEKTVTTGGSVPSGATEIYRETFTGYDVLGYTKTS